MSSKIQAQAAKFWQSVVSAETISAYAKAIDVTWTMVKEAAILLWLILCLVLVIFDWGYDVVTSAGRGARTWWDGMSKVESNEIASETGKQIVAASKASLSSTISQARTQLGLPNKPESQPTATSAPTTNATSNQATVPSNSGTPVSPVESSATPE